MPISVPNTLSRFWSSSSHCAFGSSGSVRQQSSTPAFEVGLLSEQPLFSPSEGKQPCKGNAKTAFLLCSCYFVTLYFQTIEIIHRKQYTENTSLCLLIFQYIEGSLGLSFHPLWTWKYLYLAIAYQKNSYTKQYLMLKHTPLLNKLPISHNKANLLFIFY